MGRAPIAGPMGMDGGVPDSRRGTEGRPLPGVQLTRNDLDATEALDSFGHSRPLPPRQWGALVLHYYGGYKCREIGQITGSTAATVRVHLSVRPEKVARAVGG